MTFDTLLSKRFIYTFLFVRLHFEAVYLHASARSFVQLYIRATYSDEKSIVMQFVPLIVMAAAAWYIVHAVGSQVRN